MHQTGEEAGEFHHDHTAGGHQLAGQLRRDERGDSYALYRLGHCQMEVLSTMPIFSMVNESEKHNPIKTFALFYCLRGHEALIYLQAKI